MHKFYFEKFRMDKYGWLSLHDQDKEKYVENEELRRETKISCEKF